MTTRIRPTTTTDDDPRRQILGVLRTRLGAARTAELAQATDLTELEVIDALYDLERDGLVTPNHVADADDGVDHVPMVDDNRRLLHRGSRQSETARPFESPLRRR
jgi:hypothetical protein